MESTFKSIFDLLRHKAPGVTALFIVGPDGELVEHATADSHFGVEAFAVEYAMLLRIARRASEDAGTGDVAEQIIVSDNAVIVARRLSSDYFSIAVSTAQEQLGRLRYELKRTAWKLDRLMRLARSESRTA
jgi:predicted regulator of Ras-like GTPase activity (Roadblock/LC7/MglB family)